MTTPSRPIRKVARVSVDQAGRPSSTSSFAPAKRSAQPFGSVSKSVHKRPSVGITPGGVPINDKDAGQGTGNVR